MLFLRIKTRSIDIMEKKSIGYYLENYSEAIWVILMIPMCILDIYVLSVDWNIFSLIGAIFCGLSAIINFIDLVRKIVHRKKFYGRWVL